MKISEIKNGNINKIYLVEMKENKYIIRTSDFDNSFECSVLDLLKKYDYSCPKIITNFQVENKYIMIYKFIDGDTPSLFNNDFFITLAQLLKKLHNINTNFKTEDYSLNVESQDKIKKYYVKAKKSRYILSNLDFINELYCEIAELDLDKFEKCLVHSDIKRENMIQDGDKLFLIDFGNCYIGSRLIDIIRVIMWFFIKDENYDYKQIKLFINSYFKDNNLTLLEKEKIDDLIKYCILYNLLKDISLYEDKMLTSEYIENNSLKWLKALKNKEKIFKIGELIKNA